VKTKKDPRLKRSTGRKNKWIKWKKEETKWTYNFNRFRKEGGVSWKGLSSLLDFLISPFPFFHTEHIPVFTVHVANNRDRVTKQWGIREQIASWHLQLHLHQHKSYTFEEQMEKWTEMVPCSTVRVKVNTHFQSVHPCCAPRASANLTLRNVSYTPSLSSLHHDRACESGFDHSGKPMKLPEICQMCPFALLRLVSVQIVIQNHNRMKNALDETSRLINECWHQIQTRFSVR